MRNMLRSIHRTVLGGQPVVTATVVAAAVATAVLQSTGFDAWWALPIALVVCVWAGSLMRRSRP